MSSIDMRVGERIRRARNEAGMTLAQLAQKLNLSSSIAVSRYESGKRQVSLSTLELIAHSTGKSIIWFLVDDKAGAAKSDGWTKLEVLFQGLQPITQESLLDYAEYLHHRQHLDEEYGNKNAESASAPNKSQEKKNDRIGLSLVAESGNDFA